MKPMKLLGIATLVLGSSASAYANDTMAKLDAGGLVFGTSFEIAMEKEDLFISPEKVTVDYVFRNTSDRDIETLVAFPMPEITGGPYTMLAIPDETNDNFLGFSVTMDGVEIAPKLQQRALAAGVDVTEDLSAHGVPLMPFGDAALAALASVPGDVLDDWVRRGIVIPNGYDDDPDQKIPFWTMRSAYYWDAKFPAGEAVSVSHTYRPSVGGIAGTSFYHEGQFNERFAEYEYRYCTDDGFKRAIEKAAKDNPDGYPKLTESWISYVLTTGGNWALGTIGDFTLTIDKGSPSNIVSFCGQNVEKIGPTTFRIKAKDYYPERDVNILIMQAYDDN